VKRALRAAGAALFLLGASACAHFGVPVDDSDPAVQARITMRLQGHPGLDLRYVAVDVNGGVATITGIAASREQMRTIERIVKRTHGVQVALDNLVVQE
jgi:osmotically-inducible protein OsmY